MRKFKNILFLLALVSATALAAGRIQNEDVKSQTDIQRSAGSITGTVSTGSACITSVSSTAGLSAGLFIYDSTTSGNISAGTTITAIPGTCSAGQIQMSAVGAGNGTGDTITFGGQLSQLVNDTKIYVTANSLNKLLSTAIGDGSISSGAGQLNSKFTLEGAVVPFISINGPHYQVNTKSLTAVYISALNSGVSGSTTIQVNQYRSGTLQNSATASLSASSGNPSGSNASLSGTLSLLAGDIITVDINIAAVGASDLSVEY